MTKSPSKAPAKKASKAPPKRPSSRKATGTTSAKAKTTSPAAKKRTGDKVSSVVGKVLRGVKTTAREVKSMAASLLGQGERKGKRGGKA